ncbi:NAD(P)-binding protein [Ophiobolus disseminans]|uniref:NAD(P)-binding protein n=1 Tax=Ophiobolus disseminans TaxID=1469910 RepID=A0A6A7A744_9PLEO|nr:NAD(P)-binding protein [Ophiobolus disseminans]
MPTVVIESSALVFVTGANGLIGSHVVDQLLARGYKVRGAVRDTEKTKWLKGYFDSKYRDASFEMLAVPDMTIEGCYDDLLDGVKGFIHLAAPVGGILDLELALDIGRRAGLNALKACAKQPSIKRFVNTSSLFAATLPQSGLDDDFVIDESTYNDDALEEAKTNETRKKGILIYAAMKSETEKAMWKWMKESNPGFSMNSVLPYANFGPVLVPEHQGYPSTIEWARPAFTGEHFEAFVKAVPPQGFISLRDDALLHVSALIYEDVSGERLFGDAGRWNYNQLLAIYRQHYPEKSFVDDVEGLGDDKVRAPTARAEEVLRWVKGSGWDGLEESVVAMSKDW